MATQENAARMETKGRLLARIVRVLLAREDFDTLACLTEALKTECGRLKIPWTNDDISEAYRIIESNRPLVRTQAQRQRNPRHVERSDDVRPLSRDEAKDFWGRLRAAWTREHGVGVHDIPTMTALRPLSDDERRHRDRRDDKRKAYRIIQQQIRETAQRVAALEDAVEQADRTP